MRKQYKFIKHNKTIKLKVQSQTNPCHKRYYSSVSTELSFIGNEAKSEVQSDTSVRLKLYIKSGMVI